MRNLHAFARLYGVVRWFHPSDAAAAVDWDRLAIDGAERVADASDRKELRARLVELFAEVAPTVRVSSDGDPLPEPGRLTEEAAAGTELVFWQHRGFGDDGFAGDVYASKRRHRDRMVTGPPPSFAALSQVVDATPYRGARIRLRGKLRVAGRGRGRLWLRVDRGSIRGFFDNMANREITRERWTDAEIVGVVADDATQIAFGQLMFDGGKVWYDDIELATSTVDSSVWKPIDIQDGGFESSEPLAAWRPGIGKPGAGSGNDGWSITIDQQVAASGSASLRIEPVAKLLSEELFDDSPAPGETVDIDLGDHLRARVPITLYSKNGRTLGDDPAAALRAQADRPPRQDAQFDMFAGVADVVVVWNVYQHFWPYWPVISADWNSQLDIALTSALDDRSVDDHVATMERLTAAAPDGHADVRCPGQTLNLYPPFNVDFVENEVVVVHSADPAVKQGDVILAVNGNSAQRVLAAGQARVSGSPQWRLARSLSDFGRSAKGAALKLRLRRQSQEFDITVASTETRISTPPHAAIERLDGSVYYVDLSVATVAELDAEMAALAAARGVVFDLRQYPRLNRQILSHLLTQADNSNDWLATPHVIRPDHPERGISWSKEGWQLPVLQPHIGGRVAFLIGAGTISFPEAMLGLVEHYQLGALVGQPTAGTDGNVARIDQPSGCTTNFTGLRVTKLDGSNVHLVGFQPTIPAHRTLAGVLAGRDEVLEVGLSYVRDQRR